MGQIYNIYCDESCHLSHTYDGQYMVLGAVRCPQLLCAQIKEDIRSIRKRHGKRFAELKWNRVSQKTLPLYIELVDYFFSKKEMFFRAVMVNKKNLDHAAFSQTHDEFYYKTYFYVLSRMIDKKNSYSIYLDIKDTQGREKIAKLKEVICNSQHDFDGKMIRKIEEVRSDKVILVQLVDVLIGAIQYANRFKEGGKSPPKNALVSHIKRMTGLSLENSTYPDAEKFNMFAWEASSHV